MVEKAIQEGQLARPTDLGLQQRTSIYADDLVNFLRPQVDDLRTFTTIIGDYGVASGLHTNLSKCLTHLIRCPGDVSALVDQELGCPILPFPLRYLRFPWASGSRRRLKFNTRWKVWLTELAIWS
jgi:hypothetical protein